MEVIIAFFMFATLAVVMAGFFLMTRNRPGHGRLSNRLMILRVGLQAMAVLLLIVFAWSAAGS